MLLHFALDFGRIVEETSLFYFSNSFFGFSTVSPGKYLRQHLLVTMEFIFKKVVFLTGWSSVALEQYPSKESDPFYISEAGRKAGIHGVVTITALHHHRRGSPIATRPPSRNLRRQKCLA